jgi:integrase
MAVKKLTARFVREARAEPAKERSIYWDATLPSFGLMVTSAGHKSWVLQYRNGQTSRRYTINSVLGLEDARREARNILGQVARGHDPVQERRKAGDGSKNTLRAVCERYLAREGGKLRTTAKRQANLERCVYPSLGDRQIEDIKRSDINALLDDVEDNRGAAMADQILATLRRIFNWHAIRDDQFRTPFVRGMARRKPGERERSRFLNDDELRAVWKTAEAFPSPWGQFIRFLLLTACRRTEAAEMTWEEVVDGNWVIPPLRYKTGAEVTLPLSKAAKKILAELPRIQDCQFVFTTKGRVAISGLSVFKMRFDVACGVKDWRIHDLRRTARSLLSRAGVNSDIAERCLGHTLRGIRGVYDRHRYLDEMQAAFETLASQINAVVRGQS